jgi:hypothetical protein
MRLIAVFLKKYSKENAKSALRRFLRLYTCFIRINDIDICHFNCSRSLVWKLTLTNKQKKNYVRVKLFEIKFI